MSLALKMWSSKKIIQRKPEMGHAMKIHHMGMSANSDV
jgi:hypothetical protein